MNEEFTGYFLLFILTFMVVFLAISIPIFVLLPNEAKAYSPSRADKVTNSGYTAQTPDIVLENKLTLSLHPNKILIRKYHQGIDFLGYVSFPKHSILRVKTKKRVFEKVKNKISDVKNGKLEKESFNQTMQSYLGMLKHCNSYKLTKQCIALTKNLI